LAALPPILQTCFSAPRFPDGGSPVRLAARQAALPTFSRSSKAAAAGPSSLLVLMYSRWTMPRVLVALRSHEDERPFLLVPHHRLWHGNVEMLNSVRGKPHFIA